MIGNLTAREKAIVKRAQEQAEAYERRIKNQTASITRLLDDPSAAKEIERLHIELAKAQGEPS